MGFFGSSPAVANLTPRTTNAWTTMASIGTAADVLAAAAEGGLVYEIGGYSGTSYLSAVQAYNPSTNAWTTVASIGTATANLAAAAEGGLVYEIGGNNGTSNLSTVQAYSDSRPCPATFPTAATNGTLAYVQASSGQSALFWGGQDPTGNPVWRQLDMTGLPTNP